MCTWRVQVPIRLAFGILLGGTARVQLAVLCIWSAESASLGSASKACKLFRSESSLKKRGGAKVFEGINGARFSETMYVSEEIITNIRSTKK